MSALWVLLSNSKIAALSDLGGGAANCHALHFGRPRTVVRVGGRVQTYGDNHHTRRWRPAGDGPTRRTSIGGRFTYLGDADLALPPPAVGGSIRLRPDLARMGTTSGPTLGCSNVGQRDGDDSAGSEAP